MFSIKMNWFEMSLKFKLFNKKKFWKIDLRASKKKRQCCSTSVFIVRLSHCKIELEDLILFSDDTSFDALIKAWCYKNINQFSLIWIWILVTFNETTVKFGGVHWWCQAILYDVLPPTPIVRLFRNMADILMSQYSSAPLLYYRDVIFEGTRNYIILNFCSVWE